jgi:leucine dehydrogenase
MKLREIDAPGWARIVHVTDEAARLEAILSVHDATLGPACGGCRMRAYANFEEALADVKNLSRGMTFKNALGGIPFGGGKAVIIGDPHKDKTPALFRAFGDALNALDGLYYTAEDSGIDEHDLKIVRSVSKWVGGIEAKGIGGNPSPFTARGVWRGVEAAARFRLGRNDLSGLKVAIVGVGAVGMALAEHLRRAGANLIVADVNDKAVREAVERFDAAAMTPEAAAAADVDVFSPNALGGAINEKTFASLKATIVAGGANNQLTTPDLDQRLKDRGVLYAPDYIINGAGVISVGLEILGRWSAPEMNARIDGIGETLSEIFRRAERENRPTGIIADEMAMDVITKAKRAA